MELLRDVTIEPLMPGTGHVYRLTLSDTGRRDSIGKSILAYTFTDRTTDTDLFAGISFHASPMHAIDSDETIAALLGFLTLRYGDTDREYFDAYTPNQIAFSQSVECEVMAGMASELEIDPDSAVNGQWAEMVKEGQS